MRAQTVLMENGQVYLPKEAPWLPAYEMELMLFPYAPNDDQADSTARALAYWQEQLQEPGLIGFYRMELERLGIKIPGYNDCRLHANSRHSHLPLGIPYSCRS